MSGVHSVTACVFAWNEAEATEGVVRDLVQVLSALPGAHEILLIDDGSTDGTAELCDRLAREIACLRVIHHPENRGLGSVYRTGFDEAKGDLLTFIPADGQFPPAIVADFLGQMPTHDLVLGYLPSRSDLLGKSLSTLERLLYRVLLGPMPRFQGMFMIRTSALRAIPLESNGRGWAIVMELILRAHRRGLRIKSVPTAFRPRQHGSSKVNNVRNVQANLRQLVGLRGVIPRSG